jgi:uncharacterized protein
VHYWNDGADGFIWEPLYRKKIGLTPCEQRLLMHPRLRRLQGIAGYGAGARVLPITHSRFSHTLGVFALAVHVRPEDWTLRLSALLHAVGCLPLGAGYGPAGLEEGDLGAILREHGFDPAAVEAAMAEGPLAGGAGVCAGLGLDELDSVLRNTDGCGIGDTPAWRLLGALRLDGGGIDTSDLPTARELVRRMAADYRLRRNPRCIALDALAAQTIRAAGLKAEALLELTDESALDRAAVPVPDLVDRLRNRPWTVQARPDDGGPGWRATVPAPYSGHPRVDRRPVTEVLPEARAVADSLAKLPQAYLVTLLDPSTQEEA